MRQTIHRYITTLSFVTTASTGNAQDFEHYNYCCSISCYGVLTSIFGSAGPGNLAK